MEIVANQVYKKIITEAQSDKAPQPGDEVRVLYVGRLEGSDEVFDSSQNRDSPFKFTLGTKQVIQGWEEAVATMKVGEKSQFTIKPEYGYGSNGAPPSIPGNATLVFDIELLGFRGANDLTDDGKVQLVITLKCEDEWRHARDGWESKLLLNGGAEKVVKVNDELQPLGEQKEAYLWSLVAKKLKRGEKAQLIIEAGYINEGQEALNIKVECLQIVEIDDVLESEFDGQYKNLVYRKILQEGDKYDRPKEGHSATLQLTAFAVMSDGGQEVELYRDDAPRSVQLGSGQLPEAVEFALLKMKRGELAEVTSPISFGWGSSQLKDSIQIPSDASTLKFMVQLVDFEEEKNLWKMEAADKVEHATLLKNYGNHQFKDGKLRLAVKYYSKVLDVLKADKKKLEEDSAVKDKVLALQQSVRLNLAACYLKFEDYLLVIEQCENALKLNLDPTQRCKALYRRAQAYFMRQEYDEARRDCMTILEVDAENIDGKRLLSNVNLKLKALISKQRAVYGNLFQKVSLTGDIEVSKSDKENVGVVGQ
ncbi:hypothetical protein MIR68_007668 [Amoeboaphelidium protococcarum]|nr:hypothetical protein MIR68_007668 [Amoeboaphelidium protococcarum]